MTNNVSFESRLKQKLEAGEIDSEEYEYLLKKYSDNEDDNSEFAHTLKRKYSFTGSTRLSGGKIPSVIRSSGKLLITDSVTSQGLIVSGSAEVTGSLTLLQDAKISGKLTVDDDIKIGGNFKLSGKTSAGNRIYIGGSSQISGKLHTTGPLILEDLIKISGKVVCHKITSSADIKLSGKIDTVGSVECNNFVSSGGGSKIGGDLIANEVEIAKKYRLSKEKISSYEYENESSMDQDNITRLIPNIVGKLVPNILGSISTGFMGSPSIFHVIGNVKAKSVDISYSEIHGDLIADDIIIGPDVHISGTIKYKNTINVPKNHGYKIEQIEKDS